jgi:ribonuclease Z
MKFELTILGSSSATPIYNRNPTAQLLNINEKHYLIDCGEATQMQLLRLRIKASKIDQIFISHLHGDHYFGLIGLISSYHLNGRNKELTIYGPQGLREILDIQLKYSQTQLRYELKVVEINPKVSEQIFENEDIVVRTIILNHRIPCTGFLFEQKLRKRRIIKEKIQDMDLSPADKMRLKSGEDVEYQGQVLKNQDYTLDPIEPKKYAYCSDTLYDTSYFELIREADVLYHEATFTHDYLERAVETYHTTAQQAGEIASLCKVKKLIIGHFSARYLDLTKHLNEARTQFPNTFLAIDGESYVI